MPKKPYTPNADWADHKWEMKLFELKKFKKKYGHCDVPRGLKQYRSLHVWCIRQRTYLRYEPLKYNPDRLRKLTNIGFCWDIFDAMFERSFQKLKSYYKKHGDCNIKYTEDKKLAMWCNTLRNAWRKKNPRVTAKRVKLLNSIGFNWNPPFKEKVAGEWLKKYEEVKEFKKLHGHCNVPAGNKQYATLHKWCVRQRALRNYKGRPYNPEHEKKLNKIGFSWSPYDELFEERFKLLEKYRKVQGHCHVKLRDDAFLAQWCRTLRKLKRDKDSALTEERIKMLDSIDFEWDSSLHRRAWENQFSQLLRFKKIRGNCDVPEGDKEFYMVHRWCVTQRTAYRKNPRKYSAEHKHRLDKIGFAWEIRDKWFEQNLAELKRFHEKYGHCNASRKTNMRLFRWCCQLRNDRRYHPSRITPERMRKLDKLGFNWGIQN